MAEAPAPYAGWVWPLMVHPLDPPGNARPPVVTDGFARVAPKRESGAHLGVDIMYRRTVPGAPKLPELTKLFECPSGAAVVVAAFDADVYRVNPTDPRGVSIELDHHNVPGVGPRATAYRHLERAFVKRGDHVKAGDPIGIVGYDRTKSPSSTPNHLHFELWDTTRPGRGREAWAINPGPFMGAWKVKGRAGELYVALPLDPAVVGELEWGEHVGAAAGEVIAQAIGIDVPFALGALV